MNHEQFYNSRFSRCVQLAQIIRKSNELIEGSYLNIVIQHEKLKTNLQVWNVELGVNRQVGGSSVQLVPGIVGSLLAGSGDQPIFPRRRGHHLKFIFLQMYN